MPRSKKTPAAAAPAEQPITTTPQAHWPFPRVPGEADATQGNEDDASADRLKSLITPDAGERIRVDAVALYTDPAKNTAEHIDLERIFESPFNPRTHYDPAALAEMAESIKAVGVMQPILVRPVDMPIQKNGEPVQALEVVFGHRRYRASKLAGMPTIPLFVRELTDAQAAQLQAIENVQRKDLGAIEEAEGYAHYLKVHGVTKDQLAAEIGLSRTHVYGRLKLLNGVPKVMDAVRAGEIGSEVALLISRIPTARLQEKALAAIQGKYLDMEDGGAKSFRQIRELLREKFTLKISGAMFNASDAELLPLAGACSSCSKRSGNAPEFQDVAEGYVGDQYRRDHRSQGAPNLCTDPECFDAKTKAHLANKAADLRAKGKEVVTGSAARAAIDASGNVKGAFIALKDVKAEFEKCRLKAQGNAKLTPPGVFTIQDPRTGKTVEAAKLSELKALGMKVKEPSIKPSGGHSNASYEKERKEREARAKEETRLNMAVLTATRTAAAGQVLTPQILFLVTEYVLENTDWESVEVLAELHGHKNVAELKKKLGQLPVDRLTTLLLDCILVENVESNGYGHNLPKRLMAAAKHYGVDVAQIKKDLSERAPDEKTTDLFVGAESAAGGDAEEEETEGA